MAVTIRDVAALAGVSPSTVSRTCNGYPSISKETKEKVRSAMAQLGYEINPARTSAGKRQSRNIGIILPPASGNTSENDFYLETIRGISRSCSEKAYFLTVLTGQNEEEILHSIQALVLNKQVGGFIVLCSKQNDRIIDYLHREELLYVLIGKKKHYPKQSIYIDNDNLMAGREATEYLYSLGHKRIAYVGSEDIMLFSAERKAGYRLALMEHDLEIRPEYCVEVDFNSIENDDPFHKLLGLEERPTAVVTSDDILAVALERVCVQRGLSVPDDLSIVSFNNSLFARLTSPQLTSIDINSLQLGIEAASQLISHIENPNLLATKIIVPHSLVVRKSCKELTEQEF